MKWVKKEDQYRVPLKSWCDDMEDSAMNQAEDLVRHPSVFKQVALMPDCHPGYGMPIGGVIACQEDIIPNAVGVDIGCGMGAVKTTLQVAETDRRSLRDVMTKIREWIPCGEGKSHRSGQNWDRMNERVEDFEGRGWYSGHVKDLAGKNLGTLGGGNHFIEVQAADDDMVWLMIHSGSRHLGNMIAKYYHKLALSLNETWKAQIPARDLAFLPVGSKEGKDYIHDMNFALSYARENRRQIMERFMATFAAIYPSVEFGKQVNIHHNYAALENHFGRNVWVHRKGATSARKGEIGIIPGSMGTPSYIVEGLGNPESFTSCSHGAGRVMGRKEASRTLTPAQCDKAMGDVVYDRWHKARKGKGKNKGDYDLGEAPQAYKNIEDVIESELDLIKPIVKLRPLAVVKG
jgi:tRNA-splicing ligase RtcB (3'-phosphate/5'-hydroxy nucleic acid ligase)